MSFLETDTDYFQKIFSNVWPAADIGLATNTDIPKFTYRYFIKVFWLKLVRIAYSPDLRQPLAVRMVADVTETRNVIPSLEFITCMTKFLLFWAVLNLKNFVEQVSIKFGDFYLNKMNLVQTVL